jgi:hypothetical protein
MPTGRRLVPGKIEALSGAFPGARRSGLPVYCLACGGGPGEHEADAGRGVRHHPAINPEQQPTEGAAVHDLVEKVAEATQYPGEEALFPWFRLLVVTGWGRSHDESDAATYRPATYRHGIQSAASAPGEMVTE